MDNTYIWGNVFLYCQEHDISFTEDVIPKIIEPVLCINKKFKNLCGSTLESDISILVNDINIPIQEIFNPPNRDQRIIECCKNKWYFDDFICFSKTENSISWETPCFIYDNGYNDFISLHKQIDLNTMSTDYWIQVRYHFFDKKMDIGFFIDDYFGRVFLIYSGASGPIPEYIDEFFNKGTWIDDGTDQEVDKAIFNVIDYKNVIVKTSLRKCSDKSHETQIVNGIIYFIDSTTYDIKNEIVPLVYCKECNVYYMYEDHYNSIAKKGNILCRVYDLKSWEDHKEQYLFRHLNTESIFKLCGYTVNASDDLPDLARQNLLKFMIQRDIVSIPQTLNFLRWLVSSRENNPNMYEAVKKWKSDINFLETEYNSGENVVINSIISV